MYRPGCLERYMVHVLRQDQDFVPELDLVMEWAMEFGVGALCIEGNIDFYRKSGFVVAGTRGIWYHFEADGATAWVKGSLKSAPDKTKEETLYEKGHPASGQGRNPSLVLLWSDKKSPQFTLRRFLVNSGSDEILWLFFSTLL